VDGTRFEAAEAAYAAGEWRTAAREYLGAAGAGGIGTGEAFHKAGNALMRLKRYDDAAQVYSRALEDPTYGNSGSLNANRGAAYSAAGDRERAASSYTAALEDPGYDTRYKALQGLGGTLFDMGRVEDAGDAYRRAALDDANPQPGKALNNLGLCFVSLGRPADAVEAYRAAVEISDYTGRGKAAANLGLAYMALGMAEEAARAFARAEGFGYELTDAAAAAYDAAQQSLGGREVVDGWSTGEMRPLYKTEDVNPDDEPESVFFTRTDAEMKVVDRESRRAERVERNSRKSIWVTVSVWTTVVAVIGGLVAFAWLSGLGYPTQEMTVKGLLDAHRAGKPVESFWVAVPSADVAKEMSNLPPTYAADPVIDNAVRSAKTSTVDVTITLEKGAPLTYKVSLLREGVGWKVNGVTNDWRSTGGGS